MAQLCTITVGKCQGWSPSKKYELPIGLTWNELLLLLLLLRLQFLLPWLYACLANNALGDLQLKLQRLPCRCCKLCCAIPKQHATSQRLYCSHDNR